MAVHSQQVFLSHRSLLSFILLISALLHSGSGESGAEEAPHRRFEYKYSFKGPHLTQGDGSVPFWVHTGSKFFSLLHLETRHSAITPFISTAYKQRSNETRTCPALVDENKCR